MKKNYLFIKNHLNKIKKVNLFKLFNNYYIIIK